MITLTIYTSKACPYSFDLRNDLQKRNIPFTEKVADKDVDTFVEMYKLTNLKKTPVIHIQKNEETYTFVGYSKANKEKLFSLLSST